MVSSDEIVLIWWLPQELVAETFDIQEAIHNVLQGDFVDQDRAHDGRLI